MLCPGWQHPLFLVFSSDPKIPSLLYYSHVPTALIAILGSLFIYSKNKRSFSAKVLVAIAIFFSLWSFADLILWAGNDISVILFAWPFLSVAEAAFFLTTLYFVYVFLEQDDISFRKKFLLASLFAPIVVFIPTVYSIQAFILPDCDAIDGEIVSRYLLYILEPTVILWIIGLLIHRLFKADSKEARAKAGILLFGIGAFLGTFWASRIVAQVFGNYEFEQYGFFGMVVFMGLLMYLIVRYQMFNVRVLTVQILVSALVFLVAAEFFLMGGLIEKAVIGITLTLTVVLGRFLVRTTEAEVKRKEELEAITRELESANVRLTELDTLKSQIFSFASHQLRTPITAIRGFSYLITEQYDKLSPERIKEMVGKIRVSSDRMVAIINDFLMLRRLEEGKMVYAFAEMDIVKLVKEILDEVRLMAESKNLKLDLSTTDEHISIEADSAKVSQVVQNFIDNAIKYTQEGWVTVSIVKGDEHVRVTVSDSGRGVSAEFLPKLFGEFNRDKSVMESIQGTGIGLFLARQIVEGHKGKIWVESDGSGKGSSFIFEIPLKQKKENAEE